MLAFQGHLNWDYCLGDGPWWAPSWAPVSGWHNRRLVTQWPTSFNVNKKKTWIKRQIIQVSLLYNTYRYFKQGNVHPFYFRSFRPLYRRANLKIGYNPNDFLITLLIRISFLREFKTGENVCICRRAKKNPIYVPYLDIWLKDGLFDCLFIFSFVSIFLTGQYASTCS